MNTAKCGTTAGWHRHRRAAGPPCEPCRQAWNSYYRVQRGGDLLAPLRTVECAWCADTFRTTKRVRRFCSDKCRAAAQLRARKARHFAASGSYTWAEVMRLYRVFNKCCAYCDTALDGQPEPDHVVPLSRGGSNSITNILPTCAALQPQQGQPLA